MEIPSPSILREPISRNALKVVASGQFGDMVKAVVDVRRSVIALGGDLHSDGESALLNDGSRQDDLWGINLYPDERGEGLPSITRMRVQPSVGSRQPCARIGLLMVAERTSSA
jgi:hypothetical protein